MLNPSQPLNGILLVNKERGLNSTTVSRRLKGMLPRSSKVRMGHLGTLDPLADGLLPIMFGPATRLCDHLLQKPKTYIFDLALGFRTDTLDMAGQVLETREITPFTATQVEEAIASMQGRQMQAPPLYSAIKVDGKRLYDVARSKDAGSVDLKALEREIELYEFKLLAMDATSMSLLATCSKGTYVRVLAQDLAAKLGNIATVTKLRRVSCGGFDLAQAKTLEEIEELIRSAHVDISKLLVPLCDIDTGLADFRCEDQDTLQRLLFGQTVLVSSAANLPADAQVLLRDLDAKPFALGKLTPMGLKIDRGLL